MWMRDEREVREGVCVGVARVCVRGCASNRRRQPRSVSTSSISAVISASSASNKKSQANPRGIAAEAAGRVRGSAAVSITARAARRASTASAAAPAEGEGGDTRAAWERDALGAAAGKP